MQSVKYLKKLKQYQRQSLKHLYEKHATYLLRMIRTCNQFDPQASQNILNQIDHYIAKATCHEVAINNLGVIADIETHQNRLGFEFHYTTHPDAKHVGRDLRVRLIWELVKSELEEDITLAKFKSYNRSEYMPDTIVLCPYCSHILAKYEKQTIGYHEDGTRNWQWNLVETDICEHFIFESDYSGDSYEDRIDSLIRYIWNNIDCDFSYDDFLAVIDSNDQLDYERVFLDEPTGNLDDFQIVTTEPDLFVVELGQFIQTKIENLLEYHSQEEVQQKLQTFEQFFEEL